MAIAEDELRAQLDLGLASPEDGEFPKLIGAIVRQHFTDRVTPYLGEEDLEAQRDRAWEALARLNPEYRDKVLRLKERLASGKKVADENVEIGNDDWFFYSFGAVVNGDTRAVIVDLFRDYAQFTEQSGLNDEERAFYDEINRGLAPIRPVTVVRLDGGVADEELEGVTPDMILAMALVGTI